MNKEQVREKIALLRWQERYENEEHTSFDDDLTYVKDKCYDYADQILSIIEDNGYRLQPTLDVDKLREAIVVEHKRAIAESDCKRFGVPNLDHEHYLIWRGSANAYAEVLTYIDRLKK